MIESNEFFRTAVPAWLVPLFVAITTLGGVGFVFLLLTVEYWFDEHERGAYLLALGLGGMALVVALKAFFAVPRPPESIRRVAVASYRFPSGHATLSTVVYGALAYYLDLGSRWKRIAGATLLIGLISLSRVVLGVHYVQDVVAGIVVGALFLAVAARLTDRDPRRGFWLAVSIAVVAIATTGVSQRGLSVLGATLGATLAWELDDTVPMTLSIDEHLTFIGAWLSILGGLVYLSTRDWLTDPVAFVLTTVVVGAVVATPHLMLVVTVSSSRK